MSLVASIWRLVRGSSRWGPTYGGNAGDPRLYSAAWGCWHCPLVALPLHRASPVDLLFFPGHGLQAAALMCGLLTRGNSTGTAWALCISGAIRCVAGASRAAKPSAALPVTAELAACLGWGMRQDVAWPIVPFLSEQLGDPCARALSAAQNS